MDLSFCVTYSFLDPEFLQIRMSSLPASPLRDAMEIASVASSDTAPGKFIQSSL